MDVKKITGILAVLVMMFAGPAHAMQCDVDYRAKKVKVVSTWFGKVEKPQFRSGMRSGEGKSKKQCTNNALRGVEKNGWKLTYQRVKRTY